MKNTAIIGLVAAIVIVAVVVLVTMNHGSTKSNANPAPKNSNTAQPSTPANNNQASSKPAASAGNVAITGGTNGPSCDSGGYFKPSSVTISSGETVTFSVPSDDPYSGGLQINGLPGGSMVVARGGSQTTGPITSTVSFSATWPNETACKKGSGTITVQ